MKKNIILFLIFVSLFCLTACSSGTSNENKDELFTATPKASSPTPSPTLSPTPSPTPTAEASGSETDTADDGISLTRGKYVIGEDFEAGKYTMIGYAETTNIHISDSTGLNYNSYVTFAAGDKATDTLKDGDKFEVSKGELRLIPVD